MLLQETRDALANRALEKDTAIVLAALDGFHHGYSRVSIGENHVVVTNVCDLVFGDVLQVFVSKLHAQSVFVIAIVHAAGAAFLAVVLLLTVLFA